MGEKFFAFLNATTTLQEAFGTAKKIKVNTVYQSLLLLKDGLDKSEGAKIKSGEIYDLTLYVQVFNPNFKKHKSRPTIYYESIE